MAAIKPDVLRGENNDVPKADTENSSTDNKQLVSGNG